MNPAGRSPHQILTKQMFEWYRSITIENLVTARLHVHPISTYSKLGNLQFINGTQIYTALSKYTFIFHHSHQSDCMLAVLV